MTNLDLGWIGVGDLQPAEFANEFLQNVLTRQSVVTQSMFTSLVQRRQEPLPVASFG